MSRSEPDQSDFADMIAAVKNSDLHEYVKKLTLNSCYGNLSHLQNITSILPKWEYIHTENYGGFYHIRSNEIILWVESQSKDHWSFRGTGPSDDWAAVVGISYNFTPEMELWFKLRWQ